MGHDRNFVRQGRRADGRGSPSPARAALEEGAHRAGDGGIARARGVEHEGAIVRVAIAVHVGGDRRVKGVPLRKLAEPVHAHGVEEVVAERVGDLMARLDRRCATNRRRADCRGALEAAVLLADVGEGVVERRGELLIERRGKDPTRSCLSRCAGRSAARSSTASDRASRDAMAPVAARCWRLRVHGAPPRRRE